MLTGTMATGNENTAHLLLQLVQSLQSPTTTAATATAASPSISVAREHRMLFGRTRRRVSTPSDDPSNGNDDNSECVVSDTYDKILLGYDINIL